jgi:hypothetical protein
VSSCLSRNQADSEDIEIRGEKKNGGSEIASETVMHCSMFCGPNNGRMTALSALSYGLNASIELEESRCIKWTGLGYNAMDRIIMAPF